MRKNPGETVRCKIYKEMFDYITDNYFGNDKRKIILNKWLGMVEK
jgi:hypothetical protein